MIQKIQVFATETTEIDNEDNPKSDMDYSPMGVFTLLRQGKPLVRKLLHIINGFNINVLKNSYYGITLLYPTHIP